MNTCVLKLHLGHTQVGLDPTLSTYGFHAKFSPDQAKIMFIVRTRARRSSWDKLSPSNGNHVIVMDVNGTRMQRVSLNIPCTA